MLHLLVALVTPVAFAAQGSGLDAPRQAATEERAPKAVLEEIDAGWRERDAAGAVERMGARLGEAEKRWPKDYEVLWRLSRYYFWLADDPDLEKERKSKLGRKSWEYGDQATAADASRVEGWNYAAGGMGNYALGIGVITALRQGIEGKFKDRLRRAQAIDSRFESGAIPTAWGRFWYELPWPKYSARKSREALDAALAANPDNVRALVYRAELSLKEDEPRKAREDLERAVANPPGRYDAPEERRWQAVARRLLSNGKTSAPAGGAGGG